MQWQWRLLMARQSSEEYRQILQHFLEQIASMMEVVQRHFAHFLQHWEIQSNEGSSQQHQAGTKDMTVPICTRSYTLHNLKSKGKDWFTENRSKTLVLVPTGMEPSGVIEGMGGEGWSGTARSISRARKAGSFTGKLTTEAGQGRTGSEPGVLQRIAGKSCIAEEQSGTEWLWGCAFYPAANWQDGLQVWLVSGSGLGWEMMSCKVTGGVDTGKKAGMEANEANGTSLTLGNLSSYRLMFPKLIPNQTWCQMIAYSMTTLTLWGNHLEEASAGLSFTTCISNKMI